MSLTPSIGHRHEQAVADTTWTITHNLDTLAPVVDCWLTNGTKIIPEDVVATSETVVTITFSSVQAGVAFVA